MNVGASFINAEECQFAGRFIAVFDAVGSPFVCEMGFEDPVVDGDVGGRWIYFLDCSVEVQLKSW